MLAECQLTKGAAHEGSPAPILLSAANRATMGRVNWYVMACNPYFSAGAIMESTERKSDQEGGLSLLRKLSPRRKTTQAADAPELVAEQLAHFGIDSQSPFGKSLAAIALRLYESQTDVEQLWQLTLATIDSLDRSDRIAWFNAKKFLSFQVAKLLDTLQNPARRTYQGLAYAPATLSAKG